MHDLAPGAGVPHRDRPDTLSAVDDEVGLYARTCAPLPKLALQPSDRLGHRHDFGDDCKDEVAVLGSHHRLAELPYPRCLDGARAGPPEDCEGVPGYEALQRVPDDPEDKNVPR